VKDADLVITAISLSHLPSLWAFHQRNTLRIATDKITSRSDYK